MARARSQEGGVHGGLPVQERTLSPRVENKENAYNDKASKLILPRPTGYWRYDVYDAIGSIPARRGAFCPGIS
jgi:hypothetical protein